MEYVKGLDIVGLGHCILLGLGHVIADVTKINQCFF